LELTTFLFQQNANGNEILTKQAFGIITIIILFSAFAASTLTIQRVNADLPAATFYDGFETGDFSQWTGSYSSPGATGQVKSNIVHDGNYAATFTSSGSNLYENAYVYKTSNLLPRIEANGYVYVSTSGITQNDDRFYFAVITLTLGEGYIAHPSTEVAYAGWRMVDGMLRWNVLGRDGSPFGTPGWLSAYSDISPATGQWYYVSLVWDCSGSVTLSIDGEVVAHVSSSIIPTLSYYPGTVLAQTRFGLAELYNCAATSVTVDFFNYEEYVNGVPMSFSSTPYHAVQSFQSNFETGDLSQWSTYKTDGSAITIVEPIINNGGETQSSPLSGWQVEHRGGFSSESNGVIRLWSNGGSDDPSLSIYKQIKPANDFTFSLQVNAQAIESFGICLRGSLPVWGSTDGLNFEFGHYGQGLFLLARNSSSSSFPNEGSSVWTDSQIAVGDANVWYTMQLRVSASPFVIAASVLDENGVLLGNFSTSEIAGFTFQDIKYVGLSVWGASPSNYLFRNIQDPFGPFTASFNSNGTGGYENAYVYKSFSAFLPEADRSIVSASVYVAQSGITQNDDRFYFITLVGSNSQELAYVGWRMVDGQLRWDLIVTNTAGPTYPYTIHWNDVYSVDSPSTGQWYNIELAWSNNFSDISGSLYVNGQEVLSISGLHYSGTPSLVRFGLAELYNCGETKVFGESFVFNRLLGAE